MELKENFALIQQWLLQQGRCVGCGKPLDKAQRRENGKGFLVLCGCQRVFLYDSSLGAYQRAIVQESLPGKEVGKNV